MYSMVNISFFFKRTFAFKFMDYLVPTSNLQYTNYDLFSMITPDSGPHT